jgi:hypothetical protein
MKTPIISKVESILREIVNDIADKISDKPFITEVQKKLKFQNESDWSILCSLMDVISDTELAKENFFKYNLSGPTKFKDFGEQYLRLYGITNAMYLQKSAIEALVELVKLPNKKKELDILNNSEIVKFRNIVGAHTVNFRDKNNEVNPYQFQRHLSNDGNIKTLDSKNQIKDYNLKQLILDYNDIAEDLLIRCLEKLINSIYKNQTTPKKEIYFKKIKALKEATKGGIVIWPDSNEEVFIIKVIETE